MGFAYVIIDSSAVVALALAEPGHVALYEAIATAERRRMSAFSVYEAATVLLGRRGQVAVDDMFGLLLTARVEIVPFDAAEASIAIDAYRRFGKKLNPIALNLGDCVVYALALRLNEPVLSTSDEFARAGLATVQLPRQ